MKRELIVLANTDTNIHIVLENLGVIQIQMLSFMIMCRQRISLAKTLVVYYRLFYKSAFLMSSFRHRLRHAYETDFWNGAQKTVAAVWDAHGWIWHGRDVVHTSSYCRRFSKAVNTLYSIKHLQFSV
jgi:hypothetical protein